MKGTAVLLRGEWGGLPCKWKPPYLLTAKEGNQFHLVHSFKEKKKHEITNHWMMATHKQARSKFSSFYKNQIMHPRITTCDFPTQNKKRQGTCLRIQSFHSQKCTLDKEALLCLSAVRSEKTEQTPEGHGWHTRTACLLHPVPGLTTARGHDWCLVSFTPWFV